MITRTGLYCDVVPRGAGFLLISTQGDSSLTATDEDGAELWRVRTPEPLWILRAAALPDGTICAIGNGQATGNLQIVIAHPNGTIRATVGGFVSWGQCLEGNGDHWRGAVQLTPAHWQRITITPDGTLTRHPVEAVPLWPGGDGTTSQGFLQMINGEPIWSDANRYLTIEGRTLTLPVRAGEAAVGQTEDGAWWLKPGGYAGRAIPGAAMWPRVTQNGDRYGVCAWTYPGTNALTIIAPPYPTDAVPVPVLPTVPASLKDRPLWLGYFKCISDQYGDNPAAPGNCTYVEKDSEAARSPWPYFAPIGIGEGPRKIMSVVSISRNDQPIDIPSHVMVLYDGGPYLPPQPCGTLTGLECYSDAGETFASVETRMRAWLRAWPTARVVLIGQGYTRNGTETNQQKLADLQGLPFTLAAEFPQVEGVLIFSDGRPYGTRDNEWWRPVHRDAAALVRSPWAMADHLDVVQEERAKITRTILEPDGAWTVSNNVCQRLGDGWGLLYKPEGMNWVVNGVGYSIDKIVRVASRECVDILISSEAEGIPAWQPITWSDEFVSRWRAPVVPTPPLDGEPTPPPDGDLEMRVSMLEEQMLRVLTAMRSV